MRIHDDYKDGWNVESQVKDPNSVWSFWQKMLRLRKEYEALIYGEYLCESGRLILGTFIPLDVTNEDTYAYIRDDAVTSQRILVVLNLARSKFDGGDYRHGQHSSFSLHPDVDVSNAKLLITNGKAKDGSKIEGQSIELDAWEGRIYLL